MNARPRDSSLSSFRWIRLANAIGKKFETSHFGFRPDSRDLYPCQGVGVSPIIQYG
jgi:hypothetical protein